VSEPKTASANTAFYRLAIDLGPLIVFFVANLWRGVFTGTFAFMIAITVAIIVSLLKFKRISPLLWLSAIMVIVFGGITIWLHDERFIKIKPTIYYVTVAGFLIFGLATGRNILKMVLGEAYPGLSERGWQLLARNWAGFFILMAIGNELVWRHVDTKVWLSYKIWIVMPATALFALANIPMLMRHGLELDGVKEEDVIPPPE